MHPVRHSVLSFLRDRRRAFSSISLGNNVFEIVNFSWDFLLVPWLGFERQDGGGDVDGDRLEDEGFFVVGDDDRWMLDDCTFVYGLTKGKIPVPRPLCGNSGTDVKELNDMDVGIGGSTGGATGVANMSPSSSENGAVKLLVSIL